MPFNEAWFKEVLEDLEHNDKYLTELDLKFDIITLDDIKKLSRVLRTNTSLTHLILRGDGIRNEGAMELAQALENNKTLKSLDLSSNFITSISDSGAMELIEALRRRQNKAELKLSLLRNPISAAIGKETALMLQKEAASAPPFFTDNAAEAFALLYGLNTKQNCKRAFELYAQHNFYRVVLDVSATDHLAWLYRSGCGTNVDISTAKEILRRFIEKRRMPSSLFLLADILAASTDPSDLQEARRLISKIPRESNVYSRAQWLLPFIDDQIELYHVEPFNEPKPDCIMDADLQVVALIGRGHFGKVYLAILKRRWWVAVKFMSVDLIRNNEEAVRHVLLERFSCQVLDSYEIPHLVKYIGFVDDLGNSQRGLVFEICADISLVERMAEEVTKRFVSVRFADFQRIPDWSDQVRSSLRSMVVHPPRRRFSVDRVVVMLRKVAEALSGVHRSGFLHRDIADRNVLCDKYGDVRLADLGLAKYVGGGCMNGYRYDPINEYITYLSPGHQYAVAWMAPEGIGGSQYKAIFSTNSDIYSFGVLMWQCFAHRDPFDDVEEGAEAIMRAILNDERPNLDHLDADTPERLCSLIEQCWQADPEDRPTLQEIIQELEVITKELLRLTEKAPTAQKCRAQVRSPKRCKKKWFDVAKMYWVLPERGLQKICPSDSASFTSRVRIHKLETLRHEVSPALNLQPHLLAQFPPGRHPYDVFFIHTGAQKRTAVASMKNAYSLCGLRCFPDLEMNPADGSNTETLRFALETCRHAVVVLSKEFFGKKAPCQELMYAFRRMEWLRSHESNWQSLWVVLYEMSATDYKDAIRWNPYPLPDICNNLVLYEWRSSGCGYMSWPHLYNVLKAEIIDQDKITHAVENWHRFLDQWSCSSSSSGGTCSSDFPRATNLYSEI